MHADDSALLTRILQRETYSLLQYLSDLSPWTQFDGQGVLGELDRMRAEEAQAARRLANLLSRRHIHPGTGGFPQEYTTLHYIALDHLLPLLVQYQQWAVTELEADMTRLTDPEVRAAAQNVLDGKRRHLAALQRLAADHAGTRAVSTLR